MALKHILISLFIRVIMGAQCQLPIQGYYTDEKSFRKSKIKWILNSGSELMTFKCFFLLRGGFSRIVSSSFRTL